MELGIGDGWPLICIKRKQLRTTRRVSLHFNPPPPPPFPFSRVSLARVTKRTKPRQHRENNVDVHTHTHTHTHTRIECWFFLRLTAGFVGSSTVAKWTSSLWLGHTALIESTSVRIVFRRRKKRSRIEKTISVDVAASSVRDLALGKVGCQLKSRPSAGGGDGAGSRSLIGRRRPSWAGLVHTHPPTHPPSHTRTLETKRLLLRCSGTHFSSNFWRVKKKNKQKKTKKNRQEMSWCGTSLES